MLVLFPNGGIYSITGEVDKFDCGISGVTLGAV